MSETAVRILWSMGEKLVFAWGDPTKPQGNTGLRDPFVQTLEDSWINEDGVVTFSLFRSKPVYDADGVPTPEPIVDAAACTYLTDSNGVHFYASDVPEAYDLVARDLPVVVLDADAAVLLASGAARRMILLEVI